MDAELQEDSMNGERLHRASPAASPGGAVYGLGMVGAFVWFWQQAESPAERVIALLKAIVWPAILVYEAFKAFKR